MEAQNNILDFKNQRFYIGLDVHKKQWTVTIRTNKMELKTMSMDPFPEELRKYMHKNYPGGKYISVYEAGFCGFWAHRELEMKGFKNIIAAPTEIPTSNKEKNKKRDPVDSRKLSRELENGSIKGIYIPDALRQELRSIVRQRYQTVKKQTRLKNQIKGYLNFYGHKLPEKCQMKHWSKNFIEHLRTLEFKYTLGKEQLEIYLAELSEHRKLLVRIIKTIRSFVKENNLMEEIELLCSVPGIGFTVAITLLAELIDPGRFMDLDHLASFVGLVPCIISSSDKQTKLGINMQHNKFLRKLLIEAAWISIRKDPALTHSYNEYIKRMSKQEAIIKITKKLLSRINYVWRNKKPYVTSVVK